MFACWFSAAPHGGHGPTVGQTAGRSAWPCEVAAAARFVASETLPLVLPLISLPRSPFLRKRSTTGEESLFAPELKALRSRIDVVPARVRVSPEAAGSTESSFVRPLMGAELLNRAEGDRRCW